MLQALKQNQITVKEPKEYKNDDIFVTREREVEEYDKDGNRITKVIKEKYNITRKINECAKIIKTDLAQQKLEELNKILNKGE